MAEGCWVGQGRAADTGRDNIMSRPDALANMPEKLRYAQQAVELPEVQEMLRRLAKYNLGIFMPHMHDEVTGRFRPLPENVTQVEDDLRVSFRTSSEIVEEGNLTYVPVGWYWRGAPQAQLSCVARCVMLGTEHSSGHAKAEEEEKKEEKEQSSPGGEEEQK
jgi:hypothetical protein